MADHFEEENVFDASLSIWKGIKPNPDGTYSYEDDDFKPIPLDLYTAASLGEDDFVQDILDRKEIHVNSSNAGGWTPLMYASYMGHSSTVQLLLDHDADPNKKNAQGFVPIILASLCGNESTIASLVQRGADLEAKDKRGWTALFHAASSGHQQTTKFLLEIGANLETVEPTLGLTPLLEAVAAGHEMIVQQLLQNGADVTRQTFQGETAQSLASGHPTMISLIDQYKNRRQRVNRTNQRNSRNGRKSDSGHSGPSIHAGPKAFAEMTGLGADGKPHPHSTVPVFLQDQSSPASEAHVKPTKWEGPKDLESLLSEIGCSKYLPLFKEQDIDLQIFLTLSESDLKEIGIKLFGPRRKMESVIHRLISDVRTRLSDRPETAYADGLNAKLQVAESKLKQAKEAKETLEAQLTKERKLRGVTEGVLINHQEVWMSLQHLSDKWAASQAQLGQGLDQLRSSLQEHERIVSTNRTAPRRSKLDSSKLMKDVDAVFRSSRDYLLEMRSTIQRAITSSPFTADKPNSG